MKGKIRAVLILGVCLLGVTACEQGRKTGKGLHLPMGDTSRGRQVFVDIGCYQCHTVNGVEMPVPERTTLAIRLELGGEVSRVRTYGELMTSITNPDHVISERYLESLGELAGSVTRSPMPSFNETMTVAQLIDLLAFLDSRYQEVVPGYHDFPYHYGSNPYGRD